VLPQSCLILFICHLLIVLFFLWCQLLILLTNYLRNLSKWEFWLLLFKLFKSLCVENHVHCKLIEFFNWWLLFWLLSWGLLLHLNTIVDIGDIPFWLQGATYYCC
jgi:hypothetical protein